ncbi:MAG: 30S ribosomal protein S5 [Candidatus Micrarchaeota archaeon]
MPRPGKPRPQMQKKRRRKTEEESSEFRERSRSDRVDNWIPKTNLGRKVKNAEISTLEQLFDQGLPVMEPEIIDSLIPNMAEKLVEFKKTARISQSGRNFSYRATVLVGNRNGFVGVGVASDRERQAAAQKATEHAKLNLVHVYRGCGSWECVCGTNHSIPFKVDGRCGSVRIRLKPGPKGVGLVVGNNIKDVFEFAGISDVWSETKGHTATKLNFIRAALNAMGKTSAMRISKEVAKKVEHQVREMPRAEME